MVAREIRSVNVQRRADLRVAKPLADGRQITAGFEQICRAGMPEDVEVTIWDARPFEKRSIRLQKVMPVPRLTTIVKEKRKTS